MMAYDYWFTRIGKPLLVLSLANSAPYPSWNEVIERLHTLWEHGPTLEVFDYGWVRREGLVTETLEL